MAAIVGKTISRTISVSAPVASGTAATAGGHGGKCKLIRGSYCIISVFNKINTQNPRA